MYKDNSSVKEVKKRRRSLWGWWKSTTLYSNLSESGNLKKFYWIICSSTVLGIATFSVIAGLWGDFTGNQNFAVWIPSVTLSFLLLIFVFFHIIWKSSKNKKAIESNSCP